MRLDLFENGNFDRGAPKVKELLWLICSWLFLSSWLPGSKWRAALLRLFGARIGRKVIFKPGIRVKMPWRLIVGDYSWIGEDVWIDNLEIVSIGSHVCISQGVYLCTGSHDWQESSFNLIVAPINICSHAWIAAMSVVAPAVNVGEGAVLGLGSVATSLLEPWTIYSGNPAVRKKLRLHPAHLHDI